MNFYLLWIRWIQYLNSYSFGDLIPPSIDIVKSCFQVQLILLNLCIFNWFNLCLLLAWKPLQMCQGHKTINKQKCKENKINQSKTSFQCLNSVSRNKLESYALDTLSRHWKEVSDFLKPLDMMSRSQQTSQLCN